MTFIFLAAIVAAAAPAPTPQQQHYVLNTDANVWDVAAMDITGDGKAELFAFCCDEKSEPLDKFISVYIPAADGAYPEKESLRLKVTPEASTFFFAETDGIAPKELIGADAEGASVFAYKDGALTSAAEPRFTSLLPHRSKEPFFLKNTASDLDGDGVDEWMIPRHNGYELRNIDGVHGFIPCDVFSQVASEGSVYITHRLPAVHLFDLAGEANKAVAFLSDEFADFAYGANWAQHSRFKIPVNVEEKWEAGAKMEDIDRNGLPDLVVTQTKGTVNMKAITHIYLAKGPFQYAEKPDAEYQVNGALMSPLLRDVDGDKKLDIVLVNIPLSAWNIVNYFVRGKVSVKAEVYLFKDGTFSPKSAFSEDFLLDAPEGRERVAYAFGDFSGDGTLDVVFGAGEQKLVIHTGSEDRLLSSRPWVTLTLPAFGVAHKMDLNGNAAEDLVLDHPGGANKKRIDVIVF